MRKFLSLFLAGCLFLLLPGTTWASEETTYESEQGQATIKAPSSSVFGSGDSTDSTADADSSDSDDSENIGDTTSSGIDWSAANTASRASSDNPGTDGSRLFTDQKQGNDRHHRQLFQSSGIRSKSTGVSHS